MSLDPIQSILKLKASPTNVDGKGVAIVPFVNAVAQEPTLLKAGEELDLTVYEGVNFLVSQEGHIEFAPRRTAEELAQSMWAAYSKAAGGKSFDGKADLPTWDKLGPDRQKCWLAAAGVV